MKTIILTFFLYLSYAGYNNASVQIQYTKNDSLMVINLLHKAQTLKKKQNVFLFFAREFKGTPYVAQTLERNNQEKLVINLREVDCTTFVEHILALSLCHRYNKRTFAAYCDYLRHIRYIDGHVSYSMRKHYFTIWIDNNQKSGIVKEVQAPTPPFSRTQTIALSYMTENANKYPMLVKHRDWINDIAKHEKKYSGRKYLYIPKNIIANTHLFRNTIHNGDILAIVTNKKGLDTTHIGIAVWHKDGLHLLDASSIKRKVVEEVMTLKNYMQKHPSQIGIRVIRVLI